MLIIIALIATILCMIVLAVKISDRGDTIKDLKPLSSSEQNSASKHRPEQNSTPASNKLAQESSKLLEATDKIIDHSKRLIKIYNNLQQQWDTLPDELDPDNEFSQMVEEINISRQLKETFEQIKKQSKECRSWIEQIEQIHETSKLSPIIIERHDTITTIRNELIEIIINNWDEERLGRKIAADPELGYDPYDPAYKMDLSWDEIYSKYDLIVAKDNQIQEQLFYNTPLKLKQISRQRKLADSKNNKDEIKYLSNATLNTINSAIDATYELELLIPQCHHLHRVISVTPPPASKNSNFISKKIEMLSKLGNIISLAENHLDNWKDFNYDARSKFIELSHDEEKKLAAEEEKEINVKTIRSNIQWKLLIGQATTIIVNIKALEKESDRLYKMVKDITTMTETDGQSLWG